MGKFKFIVDKGSDASNPAYLNFSFRRYMRAYLRHAFLAVFGPLAAIAGFVGIVMLLFVFGRNLPPGPEGGRTDLLILFSVVSLTSFFAVRHYRYMEEFFWFGCVNPAQVVSVAPPLVAVYTDLRRESTPYPVIKIVRQPLQHMPDGVPALGTKLATVALYDADGLDSIFRKTDGDRWDDFTPLVVDCVARRRIDIKKVFLSIPQEEWDELKRGLSQIPMPYRPGLYHLKP